MYLVVTTEKLNLIRDGIQHLTPRRRRNVRGRKPKMRNPKILAPLRREERSETRETDRERELEAGEEDILMICERLYHEMEDNKSDDN